MIETAIHPAQLVIDVEDRSMLRAIKAAIKQLKGVVSVKESTPKVRYTEQEFYDKIEKSARSAEQGPVYTQSQGESVDQFIDRLLCI